jgi:hypothetical protein
MQQVSVIVVAVPETVAVAVVRVSPWRVSAGAILCTMKSGVCFKAFGVGEGSSSSSLIAFNSVQTS